MAPYKIANLLVFLGISFISTNFPGAQAFRTLPMEAAMLENCLLWLPFSLFNLESQGQGHLFWNTHFSVKYLRIALHNLLVIFSDKKVIYIPLSMRKNLFL